MIPCPAYQRFTVTIDKSIGTINLVQIDNGGSTDISSYIAPSKLFLTYFQDGEMNNFQATFELGNIVKVIGIRQNQEILNIAVEYRNNQLQLLTNTITINLKPLLESAAHPIITVENFETQTLQVCLPIAR